ncbi:hypothetical protein RFI_14547 [Reticulomyxa filosa]|uniref:Peptidase C78, ubiquitin fold modifier-specific peptidase 1/ 2 n=1 Tax=Reticulomyxa filosa TaxID=46433 RepID=X6N8M5_RETFI|nr:hypothetical protein RFI_14547 [Reticulomyxa filosa]|eukprot:ETO22645.1 hypothetical protein RFI_14547 [Reticulomyxa filosa]
MTSTKKDNKFFRLDISPKKVYRYYSDGQNDYGWGCVYRNAQTLLEVMNITTPQLLELVEFFLDESVAKDVGSNSLKAESRGLWIEPHDVEDYIHSHYADSIGTELESHKIKKKKTKKKKSEKQKEKEVTYPKIVDSCEEIRQIIIKHLESVNLPILIDDGSYSYLISGIDFKNEKYEIIDPHYGMLYSKNPPNTTSSDKKNIYGDDSGKIRWEAFDWFENQSKTWMMLYTRPKNK